MLDITVWITFIFMVVMIARYADAVFHEYVQVMGEQRERRQLAACAQRALDGLGELVMAENLFVREVSYQLAIA